MQLQSYLYVFNPFHDSNNILGDVRGMIFSHSKQFPLLSVEA